MQFAAALFSRSGLFQELLAIKQFEVDEFMFLRRRIREVQEALAKELGE
jgi:hypothetical protein